MRLELEVARVCKAKSKVELSEETVIPRPRLSMIFHGRVMPTSDEKARIARALDGDVAELFPEEASMQRVTP